MQRNSIINSPWKEDAKKELTTQEENLEDVGPQKPKEMSFY